MSTTLSQRLFGISIRPPKVETVGELVLQLREQGNRPSTKVIVARPVDTVADALALFQRFDLHHLPVVEGTKVVGVVSTTDLLQFYSEERSAQTETPLGEIMTREPQVIREDAPIRELIDALATSPFHCLPILSPTDEIWDIVTTRDLVKFLRSTFH